MDLYSQFLHKSRYARFLDDEKRREHWDETVQRYIDFMKVHLSSEFNYNLDEALATELYYAILNFEVMPSMRALMTAGKAASRDSTCSYNCSYVAVDDPKAFDEAMHILMCFHPETHVKTKNGIVFIKDLECGQQVLSFNENTTKFEWKSVLNVVETPSKNLDKYAITLENGSVVKCTHNHEWLTTNRGWVKAEELTLNDDIVSPKFEIYKVVNLTNNKNYIGYTERGHEKRWQQHLNESKCVTHQAYNTHFKRALRKYEKECWEIKIVDFAYTIEEAHQKEIALIDKIKSNNREYGYNSTIGGEGVSGSVRSPEQRKRMGQYERTEEHKQKLRKTLKKSAEKINATRKTEKYKQEQRLRNLGANNPCYGKLYTIEQKEGKRQQAKTRKRDQQGRFV